MNYKGYQGAAEFDAETGIFYGEVINLKDVINFQSESAGELVKVFCESVDDYLEFCRGRGEQPEKA